MSRERQPEVDFFLLALFDTIASVLGSHQTSKQEFSSLRQVAETVQIKEQLTSGCRSWLRDVCGGPLMGLLLAEPTLRKIKVEALSLNVVKSKELWVGLVKIP